MKLLITGANGQLGQEWVSFCNAKGISYEAFDLPGLDITNTGSLKSKIRQVQPDAIINCAAYTRVDEAEIQKEKSERINAEAVHILASLCKENSIKLVHYSTDYVFSGDINDRLQFPNGYPETHTTSPINQYGYSKWLGEKSIIESGCDYLLIRVSWLCGKHGSNFVKTMLTLSSQRNELTVVNDQFGSPTFADNVVENSVVLLETGQNGVFHLSSLGICTWYDFASEIFSRQGIDVTVNPVDSSAFPTQAKRPAFSKLSTQKIATINGVTLAGWKEGLQQLLKTL